MTEDEINEIEKREKAATDGPWEYKPNGHLLWKGYKGPANISSCNREIAIFFADVNTPGMEITARDRQANGTFIAYAREDIPKLIAEVRRLKRAVAAFQAVSDMQAEAAINGTDKLTEAEIQAEIDAVRQERRK